MNEGGEQRWKGALIEAVALIQHGAVAILSPPDYPLDPLTPHFCRPDPNHPFAGTDPPHAATPTSDHSTFTFSLTEGDGGRVFGFAALCDGQDSDWRPASTSGDPEHRSGDSSRGGAEQRQQDAGHSRAAAGGGADSRDSGRDGGGRGSGRGGGAATVVLMSRHALHASLPEAAAAVARGVVAWSRLAAASRGAGPALPAKAKFPDGFDPRSVAGWGPCAALVAALLAAPVPRPGRSCDVRARAPAPLSASEFDPASSVRLTVRRPDGDRDLPRAGLLSMLETLGVPSALHVVAALLGEKRVVVCGSRPWAVTGAVLSLAALLAPLEWQHMLVPLLPARMLDAVCAPFPFLVGLPASLMPEFERKPVDDVVLVDLDSGELSVYSHGSGGTAVDAGPELNDAAADADDAAAAEAAAAAAEAAGGGIVAIPASQHVKLHRRVAREVSAFRRTGSFNPQAVADHFLHFFLALLGHYRRHFQIVGDVAYDADGLVADVGSEAGPFVDALRGTQMFEMFIDSARRRASAGLPPTTSFDRMVAEIEAGGKLKALMDKKMDRDRSLTKRFGAFVTKIRAKTQAVQEKRRGPTQQQQRDRQPSKERAGEKAGTADSELRRQREAPRSGDPPTRVARGSRSQDAGSSASRKDERGGKPGAPQSSQPGTASATAPPAPAQQLAAPRDVGDFAAVLIDGIDTPAAGAAEEDDIDSPNPLQRRHPSQRDPMIAGGASLIDVGHCDDGGNVAVNLGGTAGPLDHASSAPLHGAINLLDDFAPAPSSFQQQQQQQQPQSLSKPATDSLDPLGTFDPFAGQGGGSLDIQASDKVSANQEFDPFAP